MAPFVCYELNSHRAARIVVVLIVVVPITVVVIPIPGIVVAVLRVYVPLTWS